MSDRESLSDSDEDDDEEDEGEEEEDDDESGDDEDVDEEEEEEEAIEEEDDEEEEEEEPEEEEEEDDDMKTASDEESDSSEQGRHQERDERQTVIQEERESSESDSSTESEEEVQKKATETAKNKSIKEPIQSVTNLERKRDSTESFNTDVTKNELRNNAKEPTESVKTDSEVRSDANEPIKSVVTNAEVRAVDNAISRDSHPKVVQGISQETQTEEDSFVSKEINQRNEGENLAPHKIVNEPPVPKPELTDAYSMTDVIDRKNVETITETLPHLPKQGINQHVQTEEIPTLSPHVTPYVTFERSHLSQAEIGGAVSQPSLREEMAPLSSIDSHKYTSDKTVQVNYSDVTSFRRVRTQTKLKHYNVRTMTSGLIKRRTMQTCTSGLICKPEQKDRGTNTAGTAVRSRGTQTKDKYFLPESVSKQEKHPIEPEPRLSETKPSNKEVAEEVSGKEVENEPEEESNKKVRKERENVRRRRRRRREILFMPVRQSLDRKPRPLPQRKPPPRAKSAKLLPKRPEERSVSLAKYRMLYLHLWPECPL